MDIGGWSESGGGHRRNQWGDQIKVEAGVEVGGFQLKLSVAKDEGCQVSRYS